LSVAQTRADMLARLAADLPTVTWLKGRLGPHMASGTQTLGAISTAQTIQGQDNTSYQSSIVVQVFLPCVPDPENVTVANMADPAAIENLVDSVLSSLLNVQLGSGGHYWFLEPVAVTYPSDPNGQQTRAEVTFSAFDTSPWH
jgi:hypothetical protein